MPIGSVGIGRLVAHLALDTSQFTSGLANAQSSLARAGTMMKQAGRAMTTFITLPALAAGAAGVKLAMNFETAFGKMEGLANVPRASLAGLKTEVAGLSKATGRMPQELADSLFFIASSGYEAADALGILKVSANVARAGMGDAAVAADLLTAVISAYGKENITAAGAADTLTEAIVLGKAEPELMATSLGYVIPIAAQMGVSFDQVAASVAAMSRKMGASQVRVAVVNLRQLLSDLLNPAKGAEKVLKGFGISVKQLGDMIQSKGLLETLQLLGDRLEGSGKDFGDIVGNVRSLTGALELAGVSSQDVEEIFQEMTSSTGMLDRAVAAMANTTGDRARRALASLAVAGIKLGNALMPMFESLVDVVSRVSNWFTSLDQASQNWVVTMGIIGAGFGPAMIVLGSMATLFAAISVEVALVIGAIALLGLSFVYLRDNWDALKERISDWGWWQNMIIDMVQFVLKWNPWELLFQPLVNVVNWIMKLNPALAGIQIPNFTQAMIDGLDKLKVDTKDYQHDFGTMKDALIHGWEEVKAAMSGLFKLGGGTGQGVPEVIPPKTPAKEGEGLMGGLFPDPTPLIGHVDRLEEIRDRLDKARASAKQLSDAFQNTLTEAIISFGETMADVFTGDAGVSGFFDSILLIVADFMGQFGKALIAAGVAALAFDNLLVNPAAAIAAGAALVVASGVVKNILKKGPGGKSSGVSSGGYIPSEAPGSGIRSSPQITGYIDGYGLALVDRKYRYRQKRLG